MSGIEGQLRKLAEECDSVASIGQGPLGKTIDAILREVDAIRPSFSGSWMGYHARTYYRGFQRPARPFSIEWGNAHPFADGDPNPGWYEITYDDLKSYVLGKAGAEDEDKIEQEANAAEQRYDKLKRRVISLMSIAANADESDKVLSELLTETRELEVRSAGEYAHDEQPAQSMTRDSRAYHEGVVLPLHVGLHANMAHNRDVFRAAAELADLARHAADHIETKRQTVDMVSGKDLEVDARATVFIGHGHSPAWKDLKDLLHDRLGLDWQEFNRESAAGVAVTERLSELLDKCGFAFLVMTAEDVHADNTQHARENVIHEAGLFQGRYGFRRAIILLEDGCAEFSNIHGLGQIGFPKGAFSARQKRSEKFLSERVYCRRNDALGSSGPTETR
jgi:predicted nucleotide-binding protein